MKKTDYPDLRETVWSDTLPNGLRVMVAPKAGYHKAFAMFSTAYGSIDMRFKLDGRPCSTPAGVAHFLEHKMFDTKDGNALQKLAAGGASPNAYTSFQMTAYHFECTGNFEENLKTLLSFVSEPYFTAESVSKEQGIIGQEIRMYDDSPEWRALRGLNESLYFEHPIRTDIAGTAESISQITAQTLYDCHRAFYSPSNMTLCAAGNLDPEQVRALAEAILPNEPGPEVVRDYGEERNTAVRAHEARLKMEVSMPIFMLGLKLMPAGRGRAALTQEILAELALSALCGSSSPLYKRLYDQGLINRDFGSEYMDFPGGACLTFSGEGREPERVRDLIFKEAEDIGRQGLEEERFLRIRNAALGRQMRMLNHPSAICRAMTGAYFQGAEYFDFPEIYREISAREVSAFISRCVRPELSALSVIEPKGF